MSQGPFRAPITPLVSAADLRRMLDHRGAEAGVRVLDARWYLGDRRGADEYAKGHLPGAAFVDLDRDLAAPRGDGPGRHPLPRAEAFASVIARLGISATTIVVAYDDAGGAIASRVWWLFRHFGLPNAVLLDGGLQAWTAAGFPLTTEVPAFVPAARLHLSPRADVVDKREVGRLAISPEAIVLDARATERFEGKSEPIDARAGHIPGARSLPFAGNLVAPGGVFQPHDAIRSRLDAAGALSAKTVVCYCGSGVTACHDLLALAIAGRHDPLLYEGSWSDWASDPSLPAATGPA